MGTISSPVLEKYKDYSLDQLVEELYKHPLNSSEFHDIRFVIEKNHLAADKYDEYVIVIKSGMHSRYMPKSTDIESFNRIKGAKAIPVEYPETKPKFSNSKSFAEDDRFEVFRRRDMEYNPQYKQLVVSAYITDGRHVILLRTGTNGATRIQDRYTFIQGHVNFDRNAYTSSQSDFLLENLSREFTEEINIDGAPDDLWEREIDKDTLFNSIEPKFFVNDNSNHIGLEHFGIIYELKVKNAPKLAEFLTSAERFKHGVELLDLREYSTYRDKLDSWVQLVFDKLVKQ